MSPIARSTSARHPSTQRPAWVRTALSLSAGVMVLAGCSSEMVTVNRAMSVPARPGDCKLELVQADMMELSPLSTKWDYLGTVAIGKSYSDGLDPASEKVRTIIRPKACELGGTAVALMANSTSSSMMGSGSSIIFAVLRPKQAPAAPTQF
jgi:hypothetical protein